MNAVVFEHVPLSDLPPAWRAKLSQAPLDRLMQVTVRIEEEPIAPVSTVTTALPTMTSNPLFGMWRDHDGLADVEARVRALRAPRFQPDGSRRMPGDAD